MRPFDFILLAAATWRISNMLVKEDGPAQVFEKLRHKIGIRRDKDNPSITYAKDPDDFLSTLLLCSWCLSIWVAGLFIGVFFFSRRAARWLSYIPALSAVTCLVDATLESLDK